MALIKLEKDKMTTGRRTDPIPQLSCMGGTAGCTEAVQPHVVECYNRGSKGNNVQWECKANLDTAYELSHIQVSCEGYEYPDDPYVLKGSCGVRIVNISDLFINLIEK